MCSDILGLDYCTNSDIMDAVQGKVVSDVAYLTRVGNFEVDVAIEGRVVLVRQKDKPGLIAAVAKVLAEDNVNVAYMTVSRVTKGALSISIALQTVCATCWSRGALSGAPPVT